MKHYRQETSQFNQGGEFVFQIFSYSSLNKKVRAILAKFPPLEAPRKGQIDFLEIFSKSSFFS